LANDDNDGMILMTLMSWWGDDHYELYEWWKFNSMIW